MNLLKKLADVISFADGERWHPSIATFTGNTRDLDPNDDLIKWAKKVEKLPFIGTAMGGVSMHLYEVTYDAYGEEIHAWYGFPNGEQPDPGELAGTTVKIRFKESDPDLFELV
jgi:hypothetical protein